MFSASKRSVFVCFVQPLSYDKHRKIEDCKRRRARESDYDANQSNEEKREEGRADGRERFGDELRTPLLLWNGTCICLYPTWGGQLEVKD